MHSETTLAALELSFRTWELGVNDEETNVVGLSGREAKTAPTPTNIRSE